MRILVAICWVMYVVAWALPSLVLKCHSDSIVWAGYECVFEGLLALLIAQIEIVANPLFIVGSCLLFTRFKRTAAILAVLALLIASETFTLFKVDIYMDEGGANIAHLKEFGPGFYLWYGAIAIIAIAACYACTRIPQSGAKAAVTLIPESS